MVVIQTADAEASAKLARAMFGLSLPGAVQQVVGEDQLPASGPLAGKTAVERQTHRLRLPRPDNARCR